MATEEGPGWELTVTPVSVGPKYLLCDSVPVVTSQLWSQAGFVSAHSRQGLQLTTQAAPGLCAMFRQQGRGH